MTDVATLAEIYTASYDVQAYFDLVKGDAERHIALFGGHYRDGKVVSWIGRATKRGKVETNAVHKTLQLALARVHKECRGYRLVPETVHTRTRKCSITGAAFRKLVRAVLADEF